MQSPYLVKAMEYAKRGWRVLPLHSFSKDGTGCTCGVKECRSPAKHPRIGKWQEQCSTDPSTIYQWWGQWPHANVGIATGEKSGLLVIDIDPRHGGNESLIELKTKYGEIPETLISATGGGGQHIFFTYPQIKITNRANVLPGLDIRGEGGYIVAPPSIHYSGKNYSWTEESQNKPISKPPSWVLKLLDRSNTKSISSSATKIVEEGGRNDFLARHAGRLRRMNYDAFTIKEELSKINHDQCNPPLPDEEVSKIASSISRYPSGGFIPSSIPRIDWPEEAPLELPLQNLYAPTLDESMIPLKLRPWIMDISDRMQVCPEFVMAPALVAFSTVVGRKLGIHPKEHDDWLVVPNLWGAIVARPGYFKSPTIAEALKPLEQLSSTARKDFEQDKQASSSSEIVASIQLDALKEQIKKAVKDDNQPAIEILRQRLEDLEVVQEGCKASEKRYKTNDATVEKVARLLNENPNGLLLLRDELNGWLQTLNKTGREGDREFYLEAWNGYGSYTVDRVGSGTLHVPALCLSVFGGIQPGKLKAYVEKACQNGADDDGLLQRFQILIYPDIDPEWKNIDRKPDVEAKSSVEQLFQYLDNVNIPVEDNQITGVRFEAEAQVVFNEWREQLEKRLRSGEIESPAFESHLAKYRSLLPSLALLFWLIDNPSGISGGSKVSVEATKMAIVWCEFLEHHARKVYGIGRLSEVIGAKVLAKKILEKQITDRCFVRAIQRKHWRGLSTPEEVEQALAMLEDHNWIKVLKENQLGGSSRRIYVNPSLRNNTIGGKAL